MIKVEIFDSSPVFAHGLADIFTKNGFSVLPPKTSSVEGLSWRVDIFLVDPDAVCDCSLAEFVALAEQMAPVLLVHDDVSPDTVESFVQSGAQGVVRRKSTCDTIFQAIRAVVGGGQCWDVAANEAIAGTSRDEDADILSQRERQVLRQIARGLTHSQIARVLGISRHTVDTYVKRIRSKLGVGNKAELTRAAVLGVITNAS